MYPPPPLTRIRIPHYQSAVKRQRSPVMPFLTVFKYHPTAFAHAVRRRLVNPALGNTPIKNNAYWSYRIPSSVAYLMGNRYHITYKWCRQAVHLTIIINLQSLHLPPVTVVGQHLVLFVLPVFAFTEETSQVWEGHLSRSYLNILNPLALIPHPVTAPISGEITLWFYRRPKINGTTWKIQTFELRYIYIITIIKQPMKTYNLVNVAMVSWYIFITSRADLGHYGWGGGVEFA